MPALSLLLTPRLETQAAQAQPLAPSFCASNGQPRPVQLFERFINADCDSCWKDPTTPALQPGQVALDWLLPGSKGDDAPLSAVASRDGVNRLEVLGDVLPDKTAYSSHTIKKLSLKKAALCAWRMGWRCLGISACRLNSNQIGQLRRGSLSKHIQPGWCW